MANFQFFTILFSRMGVPKAQALQWVNHIVGFFERLNFMNDKQLRNSQNLHTSENQLYSTNIILINAMGITHFK